MGRRLVNAVLATAIGAVSSELKKGYQKKEQLYKSVADDSRFAAWFKAG